jgi:hypothetical protein
VLDRARILDFLEKNGGGAPKPPSPVTDAELVPEGVRDREAEK